MNSKFVQMKIAHIAFIILTMLLFSCVEKQKEKGQQHQKEKQVTAKEILGDPEYLAISYGGYRHTSRDVQPTLTQLKEDLKIMHAMGIRLLRTYNVHLPHAANVLRAIRELKDENPDFEMYVMLGAWIDCKNAWTGESLDHDAESPRNEKEIATTVALAKQYPDIVKIIAVGNEAMVHWAGAYFVTPRIILKWVNHLQDLKKQGQLPESLWITSSDDFSSWGGGDAVYHTEDLNKLIRAVDFISMHTYPYHNTYYNPEFWEVPADQRGWPEMEEVDTAMVRARQFAIKQYDSVKNYMKSLGLDKPVHIGETGWATVSNMRTGPDGSRASDEYKQASYYKQIREWTRANGITCFYFEAFDEQWKDGEHPDGSENHFGLFTKDGMAKYALWDLVDKGVFEGLTRDGNPVTKTYDGNTDLLLETVLPVPVKVEKKFNP